MRYKRYDDEARFNTIAQTAMNNNRILSDNDEACLVRIVDAQHEAIKDLEMKMSNVLSNWWQIFQAIEKLANDVPFGEDHPQVSAILKIVRGQV